MNSLTTQYINDVRWRRPGVYWGRSVGLDGPISHIKHWQGTNFKSHVRLSGVARRGKSRIYEMGGFKSGAKQDICRRGDWAEGIKKRGTKGGKIEMPKVSRGEGFGMLSPLVPNPHWKIMGMPLSATTLLKAVWQKSTLSTYVSK